MESIRASSRVGLRALMEVFPAPLPARSDGRAGGPPVHEAELLLPGLEGKGGGGRLPGRGGRFAGGPSTSGRNAWMDLPRDPDVAAWYSPVPGGASTGRGLAVPFRPGPIFGPVQACRTVGRRAGVVPGVWPTDGTHDASLNDFVRCGLSCSVSGSGKATWTLWWSCRRWPTSGRSWGNPLNPRRSARVYGCHCDHYLNDTRFRHSVPSDHSKVQP
jgi:hypothetical protein